MENLSKVLMLVLSEMATFIANEVIFCKIEKTV